MEIQIIEVLLYYRIILLRHCWNESNYASFIMYILYLYLMYVGLYKLFCFGLY